MSEERVEITITGTVQGVGFRPFARRLAGRFGLSGSVRNTQDGVIVEAQGEGERLAAFIEGLKDSAPANARIESLTVRRLPVLAGGSGDFAILASDKRGETLVSLPPDLATCAACRSEIADPASRRYRYPFTNCTDCGPRFTIVESLPYDRPGTTMAAFRMCEACGREYAEPADRRYHAEPIACPDCGPALRLLAFDRKAGALAPVRVPDPLRRAVEALRSGQVLALKGLGGFHLACDAANDGAVARVRKIKSREAKPFAVICRDLAQVRLLCQVSRREEEVLSSGAAPIVILRRLADGAVPLSNMVAPDRTTLGVMLPYTPLHRLLLAELEDPLVMTSANPGDQPIPRDIGELEREVAEAVDFVLDHDRGIVARCDDSVVIAAPLLVVLRRSRGFAPAPFEVEAVGQTMGVGGDQKNTACFIRDGRAYLTQHVGNIEDEAALDALAEAAAHLKSLFGFAPEAVGCDPHPGYLSRVFAKTLGLPLLEVQHHFAHIASCLAENRAGDRVIGVAFDGSGYGKDGTVWGGEFLLADLDGYERAASLRPVVLPGGERAVREPWRMALSYLHDAFGSEIPDFPGAEDLHARGSGLLLPLIEAGINSHRTSSAGRLFDAAAALLGLHRVLSYEGQAAMALEDLAWRAGTRPEPYAFTIDRADKLWRLDLRPLVRGMTEDLRLGRDRCEMALAFHLTLAAGIREVCAGLRRETGLMTVALSGGVFQNVLLLAETRAALEDAGFRVLTQREAPPNDGGISLGQAAVAAAALARGAI